MAHNVIDTKIAEFEMLHIDHPREAEIHAVFDHMRSVGELTAGAPQKAVKLLAPSFSGKSTILKTYAKRVNDEAPEGTTPVFYMELTAGTTPAQMYDEMRFKLKDPLARVRDDTQRFHRVCGLFRDSGCQLIMIDEIAHILKYSTANVAWRVSEAFKRLLNEGVAPIAFAGDQSAEALFSNPQLRNRMLCPVHLRPLNYEDPLDLTYAAMFFSRLDELMVERGIVRTKGNLHAGLIPSMLCKASAGALGTARNIVREALRIALQRNTDRITAEDIEGAINAWAVPLKFLDKPLVDA